MYSVDASAFIYGWSEYYPPDVFPSIWERLGAIASEGRLLVCDEVASELKRKEDGLHKWLMGFPQAIIEIDDPIQLHVRAILAEHSRLLDTRKNKSGGDPFVIALARARKATVVTGELATNSLNRPKIPDVCGALKVPCMNLVDLLREEKIVIR